MLPKFERSSTWFVPLLVHANRTSSLTGGQRLHESPLGLLRGAALLVARRLALGLLLHPRRLALGRLLELDRRQLRLLLASERPLRLLEPVDVAVDHAQALRVRLAQWVLHQRVHEDTVAVWAKDEQV